MASALVVIMLIAVVSGVLLGGFLMISLAIRREDRAMRGALRFDAPNASSRTARSLVGVSSTRWE